MLSFFLLFSLAAFLPASPSLPMPALRFTLHIFSKVPAGLFGPVWLDEDLLKPAVAAERATVRGILPGWEGQV